jgi:hypothetical protein
MKTPAQSNPAHHRFNIQPLPDDIYLSLHSCGSVRPLEHPSSRESSIKRASSRHTAIKMIEQITCHGTSSTKKCARSRRLMRLIFSGEQRPLHHLECRIWWTPAVLLTIGRLIWHCTMFTIERSADRFAALQCLEAIATTKSFGQGFTALTRACRHEGINERIAYAMIGGGTWISARLAVSARAPQALRASSQSWSGRTPSCTSIARCGENFSDILDKPAELPLQCSR